MASKQDRREEKRRERQKQKRAAARTARKSKTARSRGGPSQAEAWPVADAWLSQHWFEWEAVVHGVFSRGRDDGRYAYAAFEVDLGGEGLRELDVRTGVSEGHVQAAAVARSEEHALVLAEPSAVVRLLHDGLAVRRSRGLPDPRGLDAALALVHDVDPDDSPFDFRFGTEDEDDVTEEVTASPGLLGRLKGWLVRSPE